ncbi:MAG TPA: FtsX-like permease family protein [Chitinophagaceae bacterium]|nr:FtsX-like permease family protein [Chitinophagaceae bacterium]
MLRNYFKIAWRNLIRGKGYSIINIGGLAVGMAVAILIGLWIYDELEFDKYHKNYDRIAQVMQHQTFNGEVGTQTANPYQMAEEIRRHYGSDFKYVLQSSWNHDHSIAYGDKLFLKPGSFFEPQVAEMLSLRMLKGSRGGLKEMNTIFLSNSVAQAIFGKQDPMGQVLKIDNRVSVKVTGVYEDLPENTSLKNLQLILPWDLYLSQNQWIKGLDEPWGSNFTQTFAQIAENADMEKVSAKIRDVKFNRVSKDDQRYKPVVFLHPMSKWHLRSDFKNGVNTGGRIDNVWLFGIIGIFVVLLACINFMNLSTARSEKRAKEVGIRKAIGSDRKQLIAQFFGESVLVSVIAFLISLLLVELALPFFNSVAGKNMDILWTNPLFWVTVIGFSLITGLIAGFYPALFLSSFQPVKVLKGSFRVGRFAAIPRKILVVAQFTISIFLIIGTVIVYKQIQVGQSRPIGYNRDGLITHGVSETMHKHFETIRTELKSTGAIVELAQSGSPTTEVWNTNGSMDWPGKDPKMGVDFPNNAVTYEYGKTIGWKIKQGRDFSRDFATDSAAFILNESAVAFIGLKDPIGKIIRWDSVPFTVIGVVEDLLVQSPYKPVRPSMFHLSNYQQSVFIIRINPALSANEALSKIETVLHKYDPGTPFKADFVDEEFAKKFGNEKRISTLATFFSILAIFISCLGLFGLASFVAEQRVKEIGIRKVLGATVPNIWHLLSKDFLVLVIISCILAIPIAYYYMHLWLQKYDYRTSVSWEVLVSASFGALIITLLTVSYQAIKAAVANPVNSLRSE